MIGTNGIAGAANVLPVSFLQNMAARFGTANWQQLNFLRWQWYDAVRYPAAGAVELQFFQTPQGGVDGNSSLNKSVEETNVPQSRGFGNTGFVLRNILLRAEILPKTRQHSDLSGDADLCYTTLTNMMPKFLELHRRGNLLIKFGGKDHFDIERPFENCPPGYGVDIKHHASVYTAGGFADFGIFVQGNINKENVFRTNPIFIEPNQTVEPTLFWESTSPVFTGLVNAQDPRVQIRLIFDGYLVRAGQ